MVLGSGLPCSSFAGSWNGFLIFPPFLKFQQLLHVLKRHARTVTPNNYSCQSLFFIFQFLFPPIRSVHMPCFCPYIYIALCGKFLFYFTQKAFPISFYFSLKNEENSKSIRPFIIESLFYFAPWTCKLPYILILPLVFHCHLQFWLVFNRNCSYSFCHFGLFLVFSSHYSMIGLWFLFECGLFCRVIHLKSGLGFISGFWLHFFLGFRMVFLVWVCEYICVYICFW